MFGVVLMAVMCLLGVEMLLDGLGSTSEVWCIAGKGLSVVAFGCVGALEFWLVTV